MTINYLLDSCILEKKTKLKYEIMQMIVFILKWYEKYLKKKPYCRKIKCDFECIASNLIGVVLIEHRKMGCKLLDQ